MLYDGVLTWLACCLVTNWLMIALQQAEWQPVLLYLQEGVEERHRHRDDSQADARINNAWRIEPEEEPWNS